jgi:hypothetical protein
VIETIVLAAFFAVALGLEWRLRRRSLRLGVASLALLVLFFSQTNLTGARRWALAAPPDERVTTLHGSPLPEYHSGVHTMSQAVSDYAVRGEMARLLAVGVLFWLACSPVVRGARPRAAGARVP